MAAHFRQCHPYHQLCVSYHCQWCDSHINPVDIRIHARSHALHRCAGQPFCPPTALQLPTSTQMMAPSRLSMLWDMFTMKRASPIFHPVVVPLPLRPFPFWPSPQDVASVCGTSPSTSTQPGSLTCDVVLPSPPSPIFVDPSQSSSQVFLLGSSVLCDSPTTSSPLPPSLPCLVCASLSERLDVPSPSVPSPDSSLVADSVAEPCGSTPASNYSAPYPSEQPKWDVVLPSGPSVPSLDQRQPSTPPPPTTSPSLSPPITPLSVSPVTLPPNVCCCWDPLHR